MPIERLLTTKEFADVFRVKPATILAWHRRCLVFPVNGTRPYKWPESQVVKRQQQLKTIDIFV